LARLRVLADLLVLKGTPSPYLNSFLARRPVDDIDASPRGDGRSQ
jgi:hypothetical protein